MRKNQKGFGYIGLAITLVVILAIAIAGAVLLNYHRSLVILNGPSMEPTIHAGQEVKVHKYPSGQTPQRGDVVEYTSSNPLVKKYAPSGELIHRIIALPGERITINDNKVLVYNAQNPKGFNPDTYLSPSMVTSGSVDLTLDPSMYFIMGDNRPNALDSRALGPIPLNDIIGKATY